MARHKRARSLRERRAGQNRKGIVMIAAVVLLGAGVLWYSFSTDSMAFDPNTLCPESGPEGVYAVLVDRSDPLPPVQAIAVRNELLRIKDDLPDYVRLDVYALEAGQDLPRPKLSLCNPGSGEQASEWTQNPERIRRRWEQGFSQVVEAKFDDLLTSGQANQSPIMEAVRAITVQSFMPLVDKARSRRLYLISDMIQHSEALSQYRRNVPYAQLRDLAQQQGLVPNLQGVEVRIFYLRRDSGAGVQGGHHMNFWQGYFIDAGGLLSLVKSI